MFFVVALFGSFVVRRVSGLAVFVYPFDGSALWYGSDFFGRFYAYFVMIG